LDYQRHEDYIHWNVAFTRWIGLVNRMRQSALGNDMGCTRLMRFAALTTSYAQEVIGVTSHA
jgi:hypothetical protein